MTTRDPVENLKLAASCAALTVAAAALCFFGAKSNPEKDNLPDIMRPVEHSRTVLPGTGQLEYNQIFEMDGASRDR